MTNITRTLLHNVTIIDPENRTRTRDQSAIFEGPRIVDVVPSASAHRDHFGTVIDGEGRFALPGLIDAHIHLRSSPHEGPSDHRPTPALAVAISDTDAEAAQKHLFSLESRAQTFLYCGVTSVFDAGNNSDAILAMRRAERNGSVQSPRVFATGNLFSAPGGHGSTAAIEISEGDDVAAIVAAHAALNPDVVKITYDEHNWGVRPLVPIFSPAMLERVIGEIHHHGLKVTVHVSNETRAREAVRAGADILAHPVIQSPMTPEFADMLAEMRIPVVSTLAIGDRYFRLADNPEFLDQDLYRACESALEIERLKTVESPFQKSNRWADWMRVMTPIAQANLLMLVEAGGILAAGTDQSFGPDYLREIELLDASGLDEWQILRAATIGAAHAIDAHGSLGVIAAGALADIVLLDKDPTHDISELKRISAVIKGGQMVDRNTLKLPVNEGKGGR